jgi:hypothetical protein
MEKQVESVREEVENAKGEAVKKVEEERRWVGLGGCGDGDDGWRI